MLPAKMMDQSVFVFNAFPPTGGTGIFDVLPVGEIDSLIDILSNNDFSEVEVHIFMAPQSTFYPICFISRFILDEFGLILAQFNPLNDWIIGVRNPSIDRDLVNSLKGISIKSNIKNDYFIYLVSNKKLMCILSMIWDNPLNDVFIFQAKTEDTFFRTGLLFENKNPQSYKDIVMDIEMIAAKTRDGFGLSFIAKNSFVPNIAKNLDVINKNLKNKFKMLSININKLKNFSFDRLKELIFIHAEKWVKKNAQKAELSVQKLRLIDLNLTSNRIIEVLVKVEFVNQDAWLIVDVLHTVDGLQLLGVKHCETIVWKTSETNE